MYIYVKFLDLAEFDFLIILTKKFAVSPGFTPCNTAKNLKIEIKAAGMADLIQVYKEI